MTLVPPSGDFAYTHNAAARTTPAIYIDIAWDVRFEGGEPTGIDMDLDVVDREGLGVYIDDQDEWDEHRVAYGYPLDIVERLEALAVDLEKRGARGRGAVRRRHRGRLARPSAALTARTATGDGIAASLEWTRDRERRAPPRRPAQGSGPRERHVRRGRGRATTGRTPC